MSPELIRFAFTVEAVSTESGSRRGTHCEKAWIDDVGAVSKYSGSPAVLIHLVFAGKMVETKYSLPMPANLPPSVELTKR